MGIEFEDDIDDDTLVLDDEDDEEAAPEQSIAASTGAFESAMAIWEGTGCPELSSVLGELMFVYRLHQTHHWSVKGKAFFADHGLFERLYSEMLSEIDAVAEKALGLAGAEAVDLTRLTDALTDKVAAVRPAVSADELAELSLAAEQDLLDVIGAATESLEAAGMMTDGINNMLAGIADTHERHCYLLQQRTEQDT